MGLSINLFRSTITSLVPTSRDQNPHVPTRRDTPVSPLRPPCTYTAHDN
jgi:hypothetical protein